jgi:hypothetical protein
MCTPALRAWFGAESIFGCSVLWRLEEAMNDQ